MPIGRARQIIEPIAGNLTEARIVRRHVCKNGVVHVERQQRAQTMIDLKEIEAVAIAGDPAIQVSRLLRVGFSARLSDIC